MQFNASSLKRQSNPFSIGASRVQHELILESYRVTSGKDYATAPSDRSGQRWAKRINRAHQRRPLTRAVDRRRWSGIRRRASLSSVTNHATRTGKMNRQSVSLQTSKNNVTCRVENTMRRSSRRTTMRALFLAIGATLLAIPAAHADLARDAAIGGAVGGALGGYTGAVVGGRQGAVLGSGLGAAAGTYIITDRSYRSPEYWHDDRYARDHRYGRSQSRSSRFCPPGQGKKGRC